MSSGEYRIGWIGTGVMGLSMCGHVMARAASVVVHNRTPGKAKPLLDRGAQRADTPRQVAERSNVVFTMVGFPRDVREVYLGKDGIIAGSKSGTILVDMTTTEPSLAREIDAAARARGLHAVDAPVSGGDVGAREAKLSIMVGGEAEIVERIHPLLETMGTNVIHQGPAGAGQHAKMCNQIQIAGTMVGMCEGLIYARKAGLDIETMLKSISGGAAGCWSLENLAPRICKRNFDPGFFVDHFVKDMGIALEEAKRMNLPLPGLALAHQLYVAVQALGHGRKGTHALMLALEHMAGMPEPSGERA
jgi:3-hydroxyisobutyrate dehydrogenase